MPHIHRKRRESPGEPAWVFLEATWVTSPSWIPRPGALLFANLIALLPGRVAARTPTAVLLRAE